jgi:LDH2 family malate/lactate/ureidoglycolate dehydrogenase
MKRKYHINYLYMEGMLRSYLKSICDRAGFIREDAKWLIDSLIFSSKRGIDTHGVRLFPVYIRQIEGGRARLHPRVTIKNHFPSIFNVDGGSGLGIVSSSRILAKLVSNAKTNGIAVAYIKNSNHFGAAAFYSYYLARKGLVGICCTNGEPLVSAPGGIGPVVGTNPISIAASGRGKDIFCFDMASSQSSFSRIQVYKSNHWKLDKSWAIDSKGEFTLDPDQVHALYPAGGAKGFGISAAVEILSAGLSGGLYTHYLSYVLSPNKEVAYDNPSHFIMALSTKASPHFRRSLSDFLSYLRRTPSKDKTVPIRVPGDRGNQLEQGRKTFGIPISEDTREQLLALGKKYGIKKELKEIKMERTSIR